MPRICTKSHSNISHHNLNCSSGDNFRAQQVIVFNKTLPTEGTPILCTTQPLYECPEGVQVCNLSCVFRQRVPELRCLEPKTVGYQTLCSWALRIHAGLYTWNYKKTPLNIQNLSSKMGTNHKQFLKASVGKHLRRHKCKVVVPAFSNKISWDELKSWKIKCM